MNEQVKEPLPCPACGAKKLVTMTDEYRMEDGVVIPELERLQCKACGEKLFSPESVDKILLFRKSWKRSSVTV